ncbi:hypothetical protein [Parvibaculum sp.]|uniref:hypothetical protein n=1 Tax=Parvibaculum sp. TaxID=2024848 RepID=UPI001B2A679E|nr:hypothetical protein [Parvibaculum sp.]MBO6634415.1 hypothetical protein [Parvibaculum sp.]MBO6679176.1 hypothetical protein [Parvibaculum sp.]MBO6685687.1 hypothetical protein [Parvibaculum sp.]
MPVDLTSPWIPLGIIVLLGVFMIRQFREERRQARELVLAESAAPAAAPSPEVGQTPAPAPVVPAAAPEKTEASGKKKMKLRWRTAWIWMPFLIGFLGQAYLTFVKPMMDGAS